MAQFSYWYAYFDTIFMKKTPIVNKTLTSMVSSTKVQWPQQSALSELCSCFYELEQFILQQNNWSQSICTIDQLNKIESDVTNVLLLLQIEKLYIRDFWNSPRRVQASIAHFYAMLQIFIGSIILYQNMTLFECKAANKLCVKIVNLQNLFKSIMRKINNIYNFFFDDYFNEQKQIISNFFENFVVFMRLIPKIKKSKMFHVSQLLKYVIITNSIQISTQDLQKPIKFKSKNIKDHHQSQARPQNRRKNKSLQKYIQSYKSYYGLIIRPRKKYKSCPLKQQNEHQNKEYFSKTKEILRFIFPNWIRRHSIKNKKESIPKLHLQSIANLSKGKSNSQFHRKYSPKDEKQKKIDKIRNKSATKSRLLLKSASIMQNSGSPMKQLQLNKQFSSIDKLSMYQTPLNDEDQVNANQYVSHINQIKKNKVNRYLHILSQNNNKLFSLDQMCLVREKSSNQKNIYSLMSNYIAKKQIQKIVYK